MKRIFSLPILFLMACQSPTGSSPKQQDTVTATVPPPRITDTTSLGGAWVLQPVLDSDTATGKIAWLDLDVAKSHFVGNTGCNSIKGQFWFSKNDSSLSFGDKFAVSKMTCPGYNEPAFLKSLGNTTHYRLRNGLLILLTDDNLELSRWTRRQAVYPNSVKS
jgi:heat shock protein HslJ